MFDLVRKQFGSWICGLLLMGELVLAAWACASDLPKQISGLDLVSGKNVTYSLEGSTRATVLVFLSTRCPCSASHQGVLSELAQEFGPKGVRVLGLHSNANESVEEAARFFSHAQFSFPVIQDPGAVLADRFEAVQTPHVFVLSPQGEVLFQGGVDNSKSAEKATRPFLREALNEIVEGRPPKEKSVRVLGCQIQRP